MEKELNAGSLQSLLLRLIEEEVLEIIPGDEKELYIPYIMNDAVEAYCVLKDCFLTGDLPADFSDVITADIAADHDRTCLMLRTKERIAATIWYGKCLYIRKLYQYHRIMHCWAEGNEHIRMLVYMIGTVRDKMQYLGEETCNDAECSLIPLMEYRPFRSFSPIGRSIDKWYPDTKAGYETMKNIVKAAGEEKLYRLMQAETLFGRLFEPLIRKHISRSGKLFKYLYEALCRASSSYEERKFNDFVSMKIASIRKSTHEKLIGAGYVGNYPEYTKNMKKLIVLEEHPFTIPRMDDLEFSVHFLEEDMSSANITYRVVSL